MIQYGDESRTWNFKIKQEIIKTFIVLIFLVASFVENIIASCIYVVTLLVLSIISSSNESADTVSTVTVALKFSNKHCVCVCVCGPGGRK